MAATMRGAVNVAIRCRECQHEWHIEMMTDSPANAPKLDPSD